jgi:hypothetical protein
MGTQHNETLDDDGVILQRQWYLWFLMACAVAAVALIAACAWDAVTTVF